MIWPVISQEIRESTLSNFWKCFIFPSPEFQWLFLPKALLGRHAICMLYCFFYMWGKDLNHSLCSFVTCYLLIEALFFFISQHTSLLKLFRTYYYCECCWSEEDGIQHETKPIYFSRSKVQIAQMTFTLLAIWPLVEKILSKE